ncbi:RPA1 [Symbiodinium natans]|uniref:RPA1 protein n=1 Tax=Symbiodinium natans TaxID=878477 RepID=A0A812SY63_9DINO|nr:RPA1 [Symbiodinium natans]
MYSMSGPCSYTSITRGCLSNMRLGDAGMQPVVLEVRGSNKIGNDDKRWSLDLADGVHVVKAVVVAEMARRLEQIQGGALRLLLRLDKYNIRETANAKIMLVVLEFTVVGRTRDEDMVPNEFLNKLSLEQDGGAADALPPTQALREEHAARVAHSSYHTPERRIAPAPETTPNPPSAPNSRTAAFGMGAAGCIADAPTQPGFVEAPAVPPGNSANPYAAQFGTSAPGSSGGPFGGNPYAMNANQSTTSDTCGAPRPAESARSLSTSLAPVASVGAVTPVSALNAYTAGRWKIKARVITKGDVRKFNNQRGEGQLFKVDLADKSGEISATFFGRAVDKYYSLLKPEKVYTFQKGQIKPANKRYDRGDHVLVFEEHALIEAVGEDDDLPKISYDFRDLALVETLQPETHIDAKAVIFHVQDPFTFTAKSSNKEMTKRVVHLWDNSGDPAAGSTCELTLWGDTALSPDFAVDQVIFLKKARVTEFNGQKSLSSPAGWQLSPDSPQAFALTRSYQQLQQTSPHALQVRTSWGGSAAKRQTIDELRQEDIGLGPPPQSWQPAPGPGEPKSIHRHWVVATMTNLPMDKPPYYTACPEKMEATPAPTTTTPGTRSCNKKVTQEQEGLWQCAAGHRSQQPDFRYLCRLTILDHTDKCEVNLYDEAVLRLLKCPAKDYARVYDAGMNSGESAAELRQLNAQMEWRKCLFKLRAQKEIWQENERVRYSVDDVQPVNLVQDAKQMLAEVRESLAVPHMPPAGF